jgi:hypothetical protein
MLDRECCKMRISRQIAGGLGRNQQSCEHRCVAFRRMKHARLIVRKPGLHHRERVLDAQWHRKNAASGGKTDKAQQSYPCEADAFGFIECRFKPPYGLVVRRASLAA